MKKDFLSKIKGAILSKEEAKTISGGYDYTGYQCFFVCCPAGTSFSFSQTNVNGCADRRPKYYAPQFYSQYCVRC
jgi:hypothetical protein